MKYNEQLDVESLTLSLIPFLIVFFGVVVGRDWLGIHEFPGFLMGMSWMLTYQGLMNKWFRVEEGPGGWIPAAMAYGMTGMLCVLWILAGVAKFQGAF